MRLQRVTLAAAEAQAVGSFYLDLGLPSADAGAVQVGETTLEFLSAAGAPFYHFAFLVPGDRFAAALTWVSGRVELLGEGVFDFPAWDAQACYFHDPAGNIVELIAHRGIDESGRAGNFSPDELTGLSELGLVGDLAAMAQALHAGLGLTVWDGTVTGSLAFIGEQARTLILAREGRGWLPTGRPSEVHPVRAALVAGARGAVELEGGSYRLSGT